MLSEVATADRLNRLSAHPAIASAIGGPLDFSQAMGPETVFLAGEHGAFLFERSAPDEYEVHVMLTPLGRGAWGVRAGRLALAMMITRGAERVWARILSPHVGLFARLCGLNRASRAVIDGATYSILEWRSECPL